MRPERQDNRPPRRLGAAPSEPRAGEVCRAAPGGKRPVCPGHGTDVWELVAGWQVRMEGTWSVGRRQQMAQSGPRA